MKARSSISHRSKRRFITSTPRFSTIKLQADSSSAPDRRQNADARTGFTVRARPNDSSLLRRARLNNGKRYAAPFLGWPHSGGLNSTRSMLESPCATELTRSFRSGHLRRNASMWRMRLGGSAFRRTYLCAPWTITPIHSSRPETSSSSSTTRASARVFSMGRSRRSPKRRVARPPQVPSSASTPSKS